VRRQLGVILQSSRVFPGSLLSNIITGTNYAIQDAEAAVRAAALDKDVAGMPMGLFTPVGEGLISGGQEQRVLIARAVVGNPALLIMDESTSALDNVAQLAVQRNIEAMRATRIVIAHRLSTIARADRIYVLEKGRVSAVGTFAELMGQNGVFKELATQQML
jgi:ABC-type bacteriocin/lantibiotic exporter with double-glycine peptidase domain